MSSENELGSLDQYGERISQIENFGRIIEQAVSYDAFLADYYLKCIKRAESKISEDTIFASENIQLKFRSGNAEN